MVVISSVSMDTLLASSLLNKQPNGLRVNLHIRRRMKRDFQKKRLGIIFVLIHSLCQRWR